jgi:hypothetical protein
MISQLSSGAIQIAVGAPTTLVGASTVPTSLGETPATLEGSLEPVLLDRLDPAIEGDPGHDFRKGEVARRAPRGTINGQGKPG